MIATLSLWPMLATAAVDNWTSTTSGAWGTAGNWSGGVPINTSTVTFNTVAGLQTSITFSVASTADSLTFSTVGGSNAYTFDTAGTVNNNTLTIANGILNAATATQTFYNAFTLTGAQFWTAKNGPMNFNGNVNLGTGGASYALTLDGSNAISVAGRIADGGATAGSLVYSGTSNLSLTGNNTYTGATSIVSGTVTAGSANALGSTIAGTTITTGATLAVQGGITIAEGLTSAGTGATANTGAISNASGTNTLSGAIVQSAATTITAAAGSQLTLSGPVSGGFPIIFGKGTATGTIVLSGANTYVGATSINAGTVKIQSSGAFGTASNTGNTTVANGATLQMANNITTTNAGTLILNGTGSGSGALQSLSGNNTWDSGVILASNSTLFSATAGNTLFINANYVGARTLTLGANTLTIDGPGDTWFNSNVGVLGDTGGVIKNGTGKATFFGYDTFYTGATVVNAGSLDLLVGAFTGALRGINGSLTIGVGPSNPALARTVNVNIANNSYANQISSTSAVTINSDGALNVGAATGLGALTLNGGQVIIAAGVAITPTGSITSNTNTAHETSFITGGQVTLGAPTTITVARDATITSDLTISSAIGGNSIVKQGAGVLTLTSANTITGATISAGTINAQATNALGTAGAVTVASGAALQVQGGVSLGQTSTTINGTGVSGNGAIQNVSGNNTITGPLTVASASRVQSDSGTLTLAGAVGLGANSLNVGGGGNTTISAAITGTAASSLTKDGAGTLIVSAANPSFLGSVTVNAGTFQTNISGALTSANAVTVAAAGTLFTNGFNQTVGAFTDNGALNLGVGSTLTLTGISALNGTLSGSGTIILNTGSILTLGANFNNPNVNFQLNGGTLKLNGTNDIFGNLVVNSSSVIDFSGGAIADFASVTFAGASILTVNNWTNAVSYFYSNSSIGTQGSAPANQIVFTGFTGNDTRWNSYTDGPDNLRQITPVPEPSTYGLIFMSLALGGTLLVRARRKTAALR